MSKKITLNIGERISLINVLDQFKGSIVTYKALLDDVKEIGLSEEEKKAINFRSDVSGSGDQEKTFLKWDTENAKDKEISLSSETVKYITEVIDKKDKAGEITIADANLVSINDKIKA